MPRGFRDEARTGASAAKASSTRMAAAIGSSRGSHRLAARPATHAFMESRPSSGRAKHDFAATVDDLPSRPAGKALEAIGGEPESRRGL